MSSLQDLKTTLEKQYSLLLFDDIGNFITNHKDFFLLFQKLKKDSYADKEKIVLYSSNNVPNDILEHIQRAASKLDIPNFFILICSNFDLQEKLSQANQKFGFDLIPISFQQISIEPTLELIDHGIYPYTSLCPAIFGMVFVPEPTGIVTPCCKITEPTGNLNTQTLNQCLNSSEVNLIKTSIKNNEKNSLCNYCWDLEDKGIKSLRHQFFDQYKDADFFLYDNPSLIDIFITPSNQCNYTCRICSSGLSSMIAHEDLKYGTKEQKQIAVLNLNERQKWWLRDSFYKDILNSKHLRKIRITGGETMILRELPTFLQTIISNNKAKDIEIVLVTNASVYMPDLMNLILQFKKVEIQISIDDLNERAEIQRGGNWIKTVEVIKKYKSLVSKNFKISVSTVLSIQNILYVDKLIEFVNSNLDCSIEWLYLRYPKFLDVRYVTARAKNLIQNKFQTHKNSQIQDCLAYMNSGPGSDGKEFINYHLELDKRRNQKFSDTHKEIWDAMQSG